MMNECGGDLIAMLCSLYPCPYARFFTSLSIYFLSIGVFFAFITRARSFFFFCLCNLINVDRRKLVDLFFFVCIFGHWGYFAY